MPAETDSQGGTCPTAGSAGRDLQSAAAFQFPHPRRHEPNTRHCCMPAATAH